MFEAFKKKGTITVSFHRQLNGRVIGGQTHLRTNPSKGTSDWKKVN
jgi:hypothetical protein